MAFDPISRNIIMKKVAGFHSICFLLGFVFPTSLLISLKALGTMDCHIEGWTALGASPRELEYGL